MKNRKCETTRKKTFVFKRKQAKIRNNKTTTKKKAKRNWKKMRNNKTSKQNKPQKQKCQSMGKVGELF